MLTGYSQFKEIIVTTNETDSKIPGIPLLHDMEDIEKYLKNHRLDPVIRFSTTNTEILTDELFNQGFDFIITTSLKKYFEQGNRKTFVKFYHHEGKINFIWSTPKKFIVKDDITTSIPLKSWMLSMIKYKKAKK